MGVGRWGSGDERREMKVEMGDEGPEDGDQGAVIEVGRLRRANGIRCNDHPKSAFADCFVGFGVDRPA